MTTVAECVLESRGLLILESQGLIKSLKRKG